MSRFVRIQFGAASCIAPEGACGALAPELEKLAVGQTMMLTVIDLPPEQYDEAPEYEEGK